MSRWLSVTLSLLALLITFGLPPRPIVAEPPSATPLPSVEDPDGRAGTCFSYYPNDPEGYHPYLPMAHDAGSRWDRFDFVWRNLEPSNDTWNPQVLDGYDKLVDDLDAAGMHIVGILLETPDWAATSGIKGGSRPRLDEFPRGWYIPVPRSYTGLPSLTASAASSPPAGLELPWSDPGNHWGDFVHDVVSRYGDRVKHWEMWNEPEWTYFWTGTPAQYARLLEVGYRATKAACSDCTVLFGGLHYWADQDYYKRVLDVLDDDPEAPANDYYFDVMSIHLYSRSSNTYHVVNDIREGMTAFVPHHPIWLTETGVPLWDEDTVDPPADNFANGEEAAAYVIQSYANAWASGVERYFFFRTNDADMWPYHGLIRNDRSIRPAYLAYQVATSYLISPTMVTNWTYTDGTRRVTLWGTPRGKVSALWNTKPTSHTFQYTAILPTATLVDRWGGSQAIAASKGTYTLTLPGATANLFSDPHDYFIGGEPYLVVEEDTGNPSGLQVESLPATTYSYTVAISCTAEDLSTGIWGYELDWRERGDAWRDWPGFSSVPIPFTDGRHGTTYCFRVRAWDRAGNHGPWSGVEPCTTVDLDREVRFRLEGVFGDENGDGQRDGGEPLLTGVSLRLTDATGRDVVSPTVGSAWILTTTLTAGEYAIIATVDDSSSSSGWLPRRIPIVIEPGRSAQEIDLSAIGLTRHRASVFLPTVGRGYR